MRDETLRKPYSDAVSAYRDAAARARTSREAVPPAKESWKRRKTALYRKLVTTLWRVWQEALGAAKPWWRRLRSLPAPGFVSKDPKTRQARRLLDQGRRRQRRLRRMSRRSRDILEVKLRHVGLWLRLYRRWILLGALLSYIGYLVATDAPIIDKVLDLFSRLLSRGGADGGP